MINTPSQTEPHINDWKSKVYTTQYRFIKNCDGIITIKKTVGSL